MDWGGQLESFPFSHWKVTVTRTLKQTQDSNNKAVLKIQCLFWELVSKRSFLRALASEGSKARVAHPKKHLSTHTETELQKEEKGPQHRRLWSSSWKAGWLAENRPEQEVSQPGGDSPDTTVPCSPNPPKPPRRMTPLNKPRTQGAQAPEPPGLCAWPGLCLTRKFPADAGSSAWDPSGLGP